jgi:hypothetical protein
MNEQPSISEIDDFGMTTAFVVIRKDKNAEVVALNPSPEKIVELTKYWTEQRMTQMDDMGTQD